MIANGTSYTEAELLQRVWDKEAVRALMNRRTFYLMEGRRQEELDDLWVRSDALRASASLGKNYGWYVGMDEIARYYVRKFSDETSLAGYSCVTPMATSLIQLAGDGKTAQGMWYSINEETVTKDGNSSALWRGEKLAADFVKEDGVWKIWHLVIATDFVNPAGRNHSEMPLYYAPGEDPVEKEFGTPTVQKLTHDRTLHWADNYPPLPTPYDTYRNEIGYGPEGWRSEIIKPDTLMGMPEVKENA